LMQYFDNVMSALSMSQLVPVLVVCVTLALHHLCYRAISIGGSK